MWAFSKGARVFDHDDPRHIGVVVKREGKWVKVRWENGWFSWLDGNDLRFEKEGA